MVIRVGEYLGGVIEVGEAVVYRNAGVLFQGLHRILAESPEHDAVEHPAQNPCCVLYGFLGTQLNVSGAQEDRVAPLFAEGCLEGAAGSGGALLKEHCKGFALESLEGLEAQPFLLQVVGKVKKVTELQGVMSGV